MKLENGNMCGLQSLIGAYNLNLIQRSKLSMELERSMIGPRTFGVGSHMTCNIASTNPQGWVYQGPSFFLYLFLSFLSPNTPPSHPQVSIVTRTWKESLPLTSYNFCISTLILKHENNNLYHSQLLNGWSNSQVDLTVKLYMELEVPTIGPITPNMASTNPKGWV